jgi:hypothetical protein
MRSAFWTVVAVTICVGSWVIPAAAQWKLDFAKQPIGARPALEVRYTDASREAFEIVAERYHVIGQLRQPHALVDAKTGAPWLTIAVEDADGTRYEAANAGAPSRINLYRRGPYYCEVHWLDVQVANEAGSLAPLKGDVALYAYPDKLLMSFSWHATDGFALAKVSVDGKAKKAWRAEPMTKGDVRRFACPLFGEVAPLPADALETLEAENPLRYDAVRGCYVTGTHNPGGFEEHFYHHPNGYERARLRVTNEGAARTIYVCHETSGGIKGVVEGGVLLDADGHPLPILVQTSKNFAGEREEPFYNPGDPPFSETYFPLVLDAGETCEVTSLHLYQNWGRHMVKQWSSLGAWMDYFHSSTGVTETTCYVPFKYGGLPGIAIADLRAMSQGSFWAGQPQHDNVAGHSYLRYHDGQAWQYLVYRGTEYRSTGPDWYDVSLSYRSSDGKVDATVRAFEFPQRDELRSFIRAEYMAREPLSIANAREHFRLLNVTSKVQRLRYTHFAASGIKDRKLDFAEDHWGVRAVPLPDANAYVALYGEPKGSNAFVLQQWAASVSAAEAAGETFGPAASVWCEASGDTELMLVPDVDELVLKPGDSFVVEGFWLPYGDASSASTPAREVIAYGANGPRCLNIRRGNYRVVFPTEIVATLDRAELVIGGGRDLIPVIVRGLTDYRWPRMYRDNGTGFKPVSMARVGDLDGVQVFCEPNWHYGAVFLVANDGEGQHLRFTVGEPVEPPARIAVTPQAATKGSAEHVALVKAPWMDAPIKFRYPETVLTDTLDFADHVWEGAELRVPAEPLAKVWHESAGGSLWFEWTYDNQTVGGRLTPNEEDVDLDVWFENRRDALVPFQVQFCATLAGTMFSDETLERTWVHTAGEWKRMSETDRGGGRRETCRYPMIGGSVFPQEGIWGVSRDVLDVGAVAVTSEDCRHAFAIAWPRLHWALSNTLLPCVHADPLLPPCPPKRRVHMRGKLYLLEGPAADEPTLLLTELLRRVKRDVVPLASE